VVVENDTSGTLVCLFSKEWYISKVREGQAGRQAGRQ